jgi:hypothetical protein
MPKKRTTNRDHAKRQQRPMMEDEAVAAHLSALVSPALIAQEKSYRSLGMRDRILNLPLMVAAKSAILGFPQDCTFQDSSTDPNLARRSWSYRANENAQQRGILVV